MSRPTAYHLRWRGHQSGPYPLDRILAKLDAHEIGTLHEVLVADRWMTVQDLLDQISPAKPVEPSSLRVAARASSSEPADANERADGKAGSGGSRREDAKDPRASVLSGRALETGRRRRVFSTLGFAAGFLGAHNFYAGRPLLGGAQLLLTSLTLWLGFGLIASWLWAIAEVALLDHDNLGSITQ